MIRASFLVAAVVALGSPAVVQAQQLPVRQVNVDTTGWTLLGEQTVQGRRDKDVITVGKYEGKFDQLQLVVLDSDIDLKEMTVFFANGEKWSPALKHSFKEGQRSRVIDLPGKDRTINKIELRYANTPGGGRAKVAVYARDKANARPPAPAPVFDSRGWQLLGAQSVDRHRDRDTIVVGKYEGKFDQLTMVVLDSDIDLKDFIVYFADGQKWSPNLKHTFKEGQRTRVIDLPGNNRIINKIELAYANTPGGGKARVEVYARDTKANNNPGPMPPQMPAFDSKGWTLLGEQTVDGRRDKDTIKVGKYAGQFDQLTMVVQDSDLELRDFVVKFGDGDRDRWSPNLKHVFKEGQRSRVIDLPGKDRVIKRIELSYANLPGGGKAKVQIWGRDAGRPAPPPMPPVSWDNKGWTFLGKATVDGWRDRDRIDVNQPNPFTEVMFVVSGSDVQLNNITITLGNGEKFQMPSSVVFKEGTRTSPIDIPGKVRKIKSIEFAYANLPGGGRATVEVWARKKGTGTGANTTQPGPTQGPTQGAPGAPPPPPPSPPVVRDHR